jgi:hypothetical protein
MGGEPLGGGHRRTRGVQAVLVGVEEALGVVPAGGPAGAQEHPAVLGEATVLGLPPLEVLGLQQGVGVRLRLGGEVQDGGRPHEPRRLDPVHRPPVPAGDPVHGRVQVRAGVLAQRQVVPRPDGPGLVEGAHRGHGQAHRVGERLRQPQDRGVPVQGGGQVHDLHGPGGQCRPQFAQHAHDVTLRSSGAPPAGPWHMPRRPLCPAAGPAPRRRAEASPPGAVRGSARRAPQQSG